VVDLDLPRHMTGRNMFSVHRFGVSGSNIFLYPHLRSEEDARFKFSLPEAASRA
jgi:hypothetical protein